MYKFILQVLYDGVILGTHDVSCDLLHHLTSDYTVAIDTRFIYNIKQTRLIVYYLSKLVDNFARLSQLSNFTIPIPTIPIISPSKYSGGTTKSVLFEI